MSPRGIGSQSFSSAALRRLQTVSRQNQEISSQLATGRRVTSTSEDAVGLALASRLQSRNSQLAQSAQSVSQGTTLLSVAEAALNEANDIVTAMSDLATQATDRTLSRTQRLELQEKTDQLTAEFNRVVNAAELYGVKVLDRSTTALQIAASPDRQGGITTNFTQDLSTTIGNTTYTYTTTSFGVAADAVVADFNNNGNLDLAVVLSSSGQVVRYMGDGAGAFTTGLTYSSGFNGGTLLAGDVTADGYVDLVKVSSNGANRTTISVLQNLGVNGNFTVASITTENSTPSINGVTLGDLNGDKRADLIFGSTNRGGVFVKLAGAGGTFGSSTKVFSASQFAFAVTDLTGDNIPDLVAADTLLTAMGLSNLQLFAGNGNGGFSTTGTTISNQFSSNLLTGDFNRDGLTDLAFTSSEQSFDGLGEPTVTVTNRILLNQGGGSFSASLSGVTNSVNIAASRVADINGDGYNDLIAPLTGAMQVAYGRGDGSFRSAVAMSTGLRTPRAFGDFNNDGAIDLIATGTSTAQISRQGTTRTTQLKTLSLINATDAAGTVTELSKAQTRVLNELSGIVAAQQRLEGAYDTIDTTRRINAVAVGRILDIDKAALEAKLTAGKIRERSAEAIFAQANQSASVVTALLNPSLSPNQSGLNSSALASDKALTLPKPLQPPSGLSAYGDPNRKRSAVFSTLDNNSTQVTSQFQLSIDPNELELDFES